MDFSAVSQLRTKKFWWMDVIFYFVMSLLVATLLCYVIFMVKNNMQREAVAKETLLLQTVGTGQQKEFEQQVITYQKKIADFSLLLKGHQFASNVFAFMESQTMPNVWFNQFSLDEKAAAVSLTGESDDIDSFSRQVVVFEKNKYVKSLGTLNSSLGTTARVSFNMSLSLDPSIFDYISDTSLSATTSATTSSTNNSNAN